MGTSSSSAPRAPVTEAHDPVFDAACDVMTACKRMEAEAINQSAEPVRLAAILGVLGSALAVVRDTLEHVSDGGPAVANDREIDGVLRVVRRTLDDAAQGCVRARLLASRSPETTDGAQ